MIEPEPLQQVDRTYVLAGKRKLSYFAGCDYYRLSSHPEIISAVMSGLKKYGLNVSASRLTTGNHVLYRELERALARFFHAEDALLTSGGYLTNLIAAQALAGNFSHALIDERAHSSLTDAARFLDCPILRYRHRSPEALAAAAHRCGRGARLIVLTDGMFSHDGSAAPLAEYVELAGRDTMFVVDDAHGAGVLGPGGRGALERAEVRRTGQFVQTVTLSKAFGTYGGAILCTKNFREQVLARSRSFVSHTALPLPLVTAGLAAVKLLSEEPAFHRRLIENSAFVRERAGITNGAEGPIIPVAPRTAMQANRIRRRLEREKIFPPFIKYPGGPSAGYFRFVISSEHSQKQLAGLSKALRFDE